MLDFFKNNKLFLAAFAVLIATWTSLILIAYDVYKHQLDDFTQLEIESLQVAYQTQFRTGEDITNVVMAAIMNDSEIKSLVIKGLQDPSNNALRLQLEKKLLPIYEPLRKIGLRQLHFHTVNSDSYLRMHQPESYGDSLVGIRPTVEAVNKFKTYVSGFEEGRIFNGFRYVYPIFDGKKHIGSVETSISSAKIIENLSKNSVSQFGIIFNTQKVKETVWDAEFKQNYTQSQISQDYVVERVYEKSNDIVNQVSTKISDKIKDKLDANASFVTSIDVNNSDYVVTFMPISNFSGQNVGYLLSFTKDSHLEFIYSVLMRRIEITTIFSLTILALLIALAREASIRRKAQLELSHLNESLQDEVSKQTSEILKQTDIIIKQAKYAALGEMIGAIAHQWRQPLNSIALGVQEVHFVYELQDSISKEEMDRFCTDTLEQIKYMSRTIDDFRNFFKNDKKTDLIYIKPIISKAIFLLQKQLELNSISVTIEGDDFTALVIENELEQVILNLINNAKDQIVISNCDNKNIVILLNKDTKTILVQDFAGGISEDILDAIFHSEFSTKGEKGTGLGLYMAQMIVERHFDGTLRAYNNNGGAVFEIVLKEV